MDIKTNVSTEQLARVISRTIEATPYALSAILSLLPNIGYSEKDTLADELLAIVADRPGLRTYDYATVIEAHLIMHLNPILVEPTIVHAADDDLPY